MELSAASTISGSMPSAASRSNVARISASTLPASALAMPFMVTLNVGWRT